MSTAQKLILKQGQNLVMTPQLQQSLKILQLSNLEISEYVEQELEKNPFLESGDSSQEVVDQSNEDSAPVDQNYEAVKDLHQEQLWKDREESNSNNAYETTSHGSISDKYAFDWMIDNATEEELSLREHLLEQVTLDFNTPTERQIATYLIDQVDITGYFTKPIEPIIEQLACDANELKQVLNKLKQLDPAGVFAKDLKECLTLQLKDKNRFDPMIERVLDNLETIAAGKLDSVAKLCGITTPELVEIYEEIRELNPKPGMLFSHESVEVRHVDIYLTQNNGEWSVELNNETLPKVLVNNHYYADLKTTTKTAEDKQYLAEQFQSANWLIRAINQRAETILKVATEITRQQQEFFEKGIYFLKPMVLANVAEKIGVHESTVGRVTTNKYMETPRGIFELKYFFSSSIESAIGNDDYSSTTVKHAIKEMVDSEAPNAILSDDKLSELLKLKGMNVARRTVAKYREAMNIPSSVDRRRQKRLNNAISS